MSSPSRHRIVIHIVITPVVGMIFVSIILVSIIAISINLVISPASSFSSAPSPPASIWPFRLHNSRQHHRHQHQVGHFVSIILVSIIAISISWVILHSGTVNVPTDFSVPIVYQHLHQHPHSHSHHPRRLSCSEPCICSSSRRCRVWPVLRTYVRPAISHTCHEGTAYG